MKTEIANQKCASVALSDLPAGAVRQITVAGRNVCLANTGQGIYAVSDTCTHARVPLSGGHLEGRQIVCPWHGAMFDLQTGHPTCGPAVDPLHCYRTRIEDDRIVVEEPDPI